MTPREREAANERRVAWECAARHADRLFERLKKVYLRSFEDTENFSFSGFLRNDLDILEPPKPPEEPEEDAAIEKAVHAGLAAVSPKAKTATELTDGDRNLLKEALECYKSQSAPGMAEFDANDMLKRINDLCWRKP